MSDEELQDIVMLVRAAGQEVMRLYNREVKVWEKDDTSPVTEADLRSQEILLAGLKRYSYGILAEEGPREIFQQQEKMWVVDALDGTNDFLSKTGEFSIMLGLTNRSIPVFGVVYKPVGDILYLAQKGMGAYRTERGQTNAIRVSHVDGCADAHFVVSRSHSIDQEEEVLDHLQVKRTSRVGSIGLKVGLIAEGKAEGYLHIGAKTFQWDTCAPEIVLTEAGGKMTDLRGNELMYDASQIRNRHGVLATNGLIHEECLRATKSVL